MQPYTLVMQMLKAKLYLMKQQEQADKVSGIRGEI